MSWTEPEKYGYPTEICVCRKGCFVAGKKPCCACGRMNTQCPAKIYYDGDNYYACLLQVGHAGPHEHR